MKIRSKFTIYFIITFSISFLVLNFVINKMKVNFIINEVKDEMNISYKSVYRFTNAYSQYNLIELSKENLLNHIPEIAMNISEDRRCELYAFNEDNDEIYKYSIKVENINYDINELNTLLNNTDENKNYLDIKYDGNTLSAATIFPLYVYNKYICTIILAKDFTSYFQSINNFINLLKIANISIFLVLIIVLYLLSCKIVNPLIILRKSFKEIENGNYNGLVAVNSKDEIGDLAKSFISMKEQIKNQIETINNEKEKVLALQESKTEFFNNVTHELKTPLTTISGYSQILMEENFNDDKFHYHALERIDKESNRMHKMISTLIDLSKNNSDMSNKELTLINTKDLLDEIILDLSINADRHKVNISSNIEDITFNFVEDDIKRLFINLIDNSIKYSLPNTTIEITSIIKDNIYNFIIKNASNEISKHGLSNVFQPFYRENINRSRVLGSNGLGLFICAKIVEQYNGKINFSYGDNSVIVTVKFIIG